MQFLDVIDALARGGAATVSLLVAGMLLLSRPIRPAAVFGAAFSAGAAVYAIVAIPAIQQTLGGMFVPLKTLAIAAPAFFWLFVMALYDDAFRFRPWMAIPPALAVALFLSCQAWPTFEPLSRAFQLAIATPLMAHALWLTRCNLAADLVETRRRLSGILAVMVPVLAAGIILIEIQEALNFHREWTAPIQSFGLLALSLAFASNFMAIRTALLPEAPAVRLPASANGQKLAPADRLDLDKLKALVENGAFLDPGLTIGEFASRAGMPEHRVRRLINKGLGYRNFAAFLNEYRIEEAKRRLSDPALAREQITRLAFDVGYASLAPFNRAFRELTGESPTEYRQKALSVPTVHPAPSPSGRRPASVSLH